MPLPITIPNTFANATATIPLSQLDNNFSTVAVAVNSIGNGAFSLANVQINGGTIANVTLDNVSVDVETLSNVTITNLTVDGNVTFTNAAVTANVVTITTANVTTANVTTLESGNVAITGGTINVSSVIATDDVTVGDDLVFTGTGNRITGDFSNATLANRVSFQTSTTNGVTVISAIPNGTATQSNLSTCNNSDPTNASNLNILVNATEASVRSGITGTGTYLPMTFFTGGSERMRVDTSGNLLLGTSTTRTNYSSGSITPAFQIEKAADVRSSITRDSNDAGGPVIYLGKTRGATVNSNTVVADGDNLGLLAFEGADGTNLIRAAAIAAQVDGTPGANDMPGRLVFSTTADGGTAATERMRINSSGNVGIGISAPTSRLHSYATSGTTTTLGRFEAAIGSYTGTSLIAANTLGASSAFNLFSCITDSDGDAGGPVTQFLVRGDGNVGIGTSTPDTLLNIQGIDPTLLIQDSDEAGDGFIKFQTANGTQRAFIQAAMTANVMVLGTGTTERARIDASGNLIVATGGSSITAGGGTPRFSMNYSSNSGPGYTIQDTDPQNGNTFIRFVNAGTVAGSITSNGTTTMTYGSASDYRLKENLTPLTGALTKIAALQPKSGNWKVDGSEFVGFLAHELQEVFPDAVVGEKDRVDADGNPLHQMVDTGSASIIATLTAAIQEQQAMIEELKAKVAALEEK
jgi:hypothetical protein